MTMDINEAREIVDPLHEPVQDRIGRTIAEKKRLYVALADVPDHLWRLDAYEVWEVRTCRGWVMAARFSTPRGKVYCPPNEDAESTAESPEPAQMAPDATEGTSRVAMDAVGMSVCSLSAEIIAECGDNRCVHLNDSGLMCEKLDEIRKLATNIEEMSQPRSRVCPPSDEQRAHLRERALESVGRAEAEVKRYFDRAEGMPEALGAVCDAIRTAIDEVPA